MPDLSRTRHTLTCRDGFANGRDRHRSCPIIERTVDPRHMALLSMHPLEEGSDLIQCQGGRQAARQIHMDFIRTTRRIRAQFSDAA